SNDEVEPSTRRCVGEVYGKREGKRCPRTKRGDPAPELARAQPQVVQHSTLHRGGNRPLGEEIARTHRANEVAPARGNRVTLTFGHEDRGAAFFAVERAYRPRSRASAAGASIRRDSSNAGPASASPTRMCRSRFGSGDTASGSPSSASMTTESHSRGSQGQPAAAFP